MKKAQTNTMVSIVDKKEMILQNSQNLVIYWYILCGKERHWVTHQIVMPLLESEIERNVTQL